MSPERAEPLGCLEGSTSALTPCSKGEGQSLGGPLLSLPEEEGHGPLPCSWVVYYYYFGVSFVN